jgi:hypothetical protein
MPMLQSYFIEAHEAFALYKKPRDTSGCLSAVTGLLLSRQEVWPLCTKPIGYVFMQVILANGSFKRAVGSAREEDEHSGPLV